MLASILDLSENPTLPDTILYQAAGLALVMFALSLLYAISSVIGAGFKRSEAARHARSTAAAPSPAMQLPDGVSPEVVAAISGAVAVALTGKHRILGVRRLAEPVDWTESMLRSWSHEGRVKHFDSHKTR